MALFRRRFRSDLQTLKAIAEKWYEHWDNRGWESAVVLESCGLEPGIKSSLARVIQND
jgi:hypothetical protein